jgi:hypothetical protein
MTKPSLFHFEKQHKFPCGYIIIIFPQNIETEGRDSVRTVVGQTKMLRQIQSQEFVYYII